MNAKPCGGFSYAAMCNFGEEDKGRDDWFEMSVEDGVKVTVYTIQCKGPQATHFAGVANDASFCARGEGQVKAKCNAR